MFLEAIYYTAYLLGTKFEIMLTTLSLKECQQIYYWNLFTLFTRIAGDFGLVAQNPLTENGLLFMILSSSAVPVWDPIKTRIIKLFERKHWLRIYRSIIN